MSKQQQKRIRYLTGHFLGWGDDRPPHRYIKLVTDNGERLVKVAKNLRPHIQDWQPGIWLTLITQEKICRYTGELKIKVKQLVTAPTIESTPITSHPFVPTKIQVCQGSTCRRRGSERICQAMQAHIDGHDLTERVKIEAVKCLHQCKTAPHAIVISPTGETPSQKTHYRQIQPTQVQALLAKHFPTNSPPQSIGTNLIEKISNYVQQQQIVTAGTTF
jgi:NADH:ubiquinone oxidoreductase subunit E